MSDNRFDNRTERGTPRRRAQARREGQVVKSLDLNSAALLSLGFITLFLMAPFMTEQMMNIMRMAVSSAPQITVAETSYTALASAMIIKFVFLMGPLFAVLFVTALAVNIVQVGFSFSTKAMTPRFDRLSPVEGFKRLFSTRSLVAFLRDGFKLVVIGLVAYLLIKNEFESFFILADASIGTFASTVGLMTVSLVLKISGIILVIGLIDYLYQKYEFEKSIRMSKQDIRDEQKDTEGSSQIKSRARQHNLDTSQNLTDESNN